MPERFENAWRGGALVVAAYVAACGAPLEGSSSSHSSNGTGQSSSTASAPAPTSPLPGESSADSICGAGWRWNGVHCIATGIGGDIGSGSGSATASADPSNPADGKNRTRDPAASGPHVKIDEIKVGSGAEAHENSHVRIHYVGKLTDGTTFDSSRDRNSPFSFTIGVGEVIRGFDQGVTGMKVGGLRKVTIPPVLGYGRRGAPPKIPPDSTLVFEIELLGVE